MLDELEKAAKVFNYIEFGWRDFDKVAGIGANVVKREFGGWKKALSALKESTTMSNNGIEKKKVFIATFG